MCFYIYNLKPDKVKEKTKPNFISLSIVFALTMILTANCFGQTVIFSEDFSDNHRKWEDDSDSTENSFVKDGKYYIKINESDKKGWHWFSMPTNISDEKNWVIETTMYVDRISNEEYVGLVWGAQDASNMQEVVFYPKERTFSSGVLTDSSFSDLFNAVVMDSIKTNKLVFTLLKVAKKYYCLLNGRPAGKTAFYKLQGNKVGFILNGKSEISIDDLNIKELDKSSQLAKQIIDKFPLTEEREYYYDSDHITWHAKGEGIEFNTKESSDYYRVFTVNDDEEVVGYVKEYDSKTDKLLKKFQAKSIDKWGNIGDVLIGEETDYDEYGNVTLRAVYHNDQEKPWIEFGKHLNADLYGFNSDGKIELYREVRDAKITMEISFAADEEIQRAEKITDKCYYQKNGFGKYDKIYAEKFDPPLLDWLEIDIKSSKSKITDDCYYIESKVASGANRSSNFAIDFNKNDFSISVYTQFVKGQEAVSVLLGDDPLNHTAFSISPSGVYTVFNIYNGIRTDFTNEWERTSLLREDGSNAIDIVKLGSKIYFSINGTKVISHDYFPTTKNCVTFLVLGQNNAACFSNLTVKELNIDLPSSLSKFSPKSNSGGYLGSGSGFFLSSSGYIITNNHVIEDAKEIYVDVNEDAGTKTYKAILIKTDEKNDLAILKISKNMPSLPYSLNSNQADVGTSIFTLGYPYALTYLGKEVKFTDGKISSKSGFDNDATTYQISVPVQPGNSGGPLFDSKGNLVGVVNAKFTKGDNVSYAIKSSVLKTFLDLNSTVPKPSSILKTDEIPVTSLIKKLEKFVVLIKTK